MEISKWKERKEVSECYNNLFKPIDNTEKTVLERVIKKSLKKDPTNIEVAYVIAICVNLLNPKCYKLKLATKLMKRKVKYYLVSFIISLILLYLK